MQANTRIRHLFAGLFALGLASAARGAFAAGTFYVEGSNASCLNTGAGTGTEAVPYCSIAAAERARGGPGTTILVKPGTYREQTTVQHSGAVGNLLVIKALGSPVVIDGADDFSTAGQWNLFSGNVFLASTAPGGQVYVDGVRLPVWTALPADTPPGFFAFVSGEGTYVNLGGDNPGVHATFIGKRSNGFRLNGRTYVTILGFTVTRTEDYGIRLVGGSSNVSVIGNTVVFTMNTGISVSGGTNVLVASNVVQDTSNNGISFLSGVTSSTIQDNESFGNRKDTRATTPRGINLDGTSQVVVQRNRIHHNEFGGLQINNSLDTISLQNRSWQNDRAGFAHLHSTGTIHIGDVSSRNLQEGFSIQASTASLYDCLVAENVGFQLFVDAALPPALVSDSNLFWNSTNTVVIRYRKTSTDPFVSATVAGFASDTGQEVHGLQTDPMFVNPVTADFHLLAGSPAIDSADSQSSSWPATDAEGRSRFDDTTTANTGLGPVTYADRGALEYDPGCGGPVGQQCGSSDVGLCQFGTTQCIDNKLQCVGNVEPALEVCDGEDNDCDGTVDNASAPLGTPTLSVSPLTGTTTQLTWTTVPAADHYDVVSGAINLLKTSGGDFTAATDHCLVNDTTLTSVQDSAVPLAGDSLWYAVRGTNSCGPGTYDEDDPSQVGLRDAEIAASAAPCP